MANLTTTNGVKGRRGTYLELIDRLEKMGCDPIAALARIVMNQNPDGTPYQETKYIGRGENMQTIVVTHYPPEAVIAAAKELLAYMYGKRKSVEVAHVQEKPFTFVVQPVSAHEPPTIPGEYIDQDDRLLEAGSEDHDTLITEEDTEAH
jgi:hypothetical protein